MAHQEPRVICFDLDDTIIATSHLYHQVMWECGLIIHRALGIRSPFPDAVLKLQQEIDRELIHNGGMANDHFPVSIVRTYEKLAADRGLNPDPAVLRAIKHASRAHRDGPFVTLPGAPETLRTLHAAGHTLHLVTMGEQKLQRRKIKDTGLRKLFDSVHVTGTDKRTAIARCIDGQEPSRCVMVGDSLRSDIASAVALGMVAVWIPGDPWPFAQADVPAESYHRLSGVGDVPEFIRSLP